VWGRKAVDGRAVGFVVVLFDRQARSAEIEMLASIRSASGRVSRPR
jgi:hypothetical protein